MTVDVYGHLVPGVNRAAMDRLPTVEDPAEESLASLPTESSVTLEELAQSSS